MLEDVAEEITESWMLNRKDPIETEELWLLRNRIWTSWGLWLLASGALAAVMAGFLQEWGWDIAVGAFVIFQVTRLMRAYRRPKLGNWQVRRHLYRLSFLLPWLVAPLSADFGNRPANVVGWLAYLSTLVLLYQVQVRDDLKILKAIPLVIEWLKNKTDP